MPDMALRYAHLTKPDVSAKFRRASRRITCEPAGDEVTLEGIAVSSPNLV